jgi:EAL domain-containing protein (putative c-di-GMP-specific phosphodiesterase class I)
MNERYNSKDEKKTELLNIIQSNRLTMVFQPIYNLKTGNVYAYEALCRIQGESLFADIEALFHIAKKSNLTFLLEKHCRRKALSAAPAFGHDYPIALNVCPSVLMKRKNGEKTPELFDELYFMRHRIILELTERFNVRNHSSLVKTVEYYRRHGFKIAFDDLGAGFTRLKMLAQIQPCILKIDRFLIENIHQSPQKQILLESIMYFSRKINAQVVAEGIETKEELRTIIKMKVDFAQGHYLCRPSDTFQHCEPGAKEDIQSINSQIARKNSNHSDYGNEEILRPVACAINS